MNLYYILLIVLWLTLTVEIASAEQLPAEDTSCTSSVDPDGEERRCSVLWLAAISAGATTGDGGQ